MEQFLSHMDYLRVSGDDCCQTFCGSDQEWYPEQRQRRTGCGPSVAANLLFYLCHREDASCCGRTRADLLRLMEQAWDYITPAENGIPSTALFLEKIKKYATAHQEQFQYFSMNVPQERKERPTLYDVTQFVARGIEADSPVAFLNLDNGAEANLEAWHWVTISGLYPSADFEQVYLRICDEGKSKRIDLRLWLESTAQGGGFVYLTSGIERNQ